MQLFTTYAASPGLAAMAVYCWQHRATHQLQLEDVEVLVYVLGAMVVDGYKLGDDSTQHAPDCPIEMVQLGRNAEGYAEHVEQGIDGRSADDPVSSVIEAVPSIGPQICQMASARCPGHAAVPAGEQLDAERRGQSSPEGRDKYPGGAVAEDRCALCQSTDFHAPRCAGMSEQARKRINRGPVLPDAEAGADQ